jgi:hypothetical protein
MGWSLSWAAVRGGTRDVVCSVTGLRPIGQREEVPESNIVCANLPSGWFLVLFNRKEIKDHVLEKLSKCGELVYCSVEDHVMCTTASGWANGKRNWRITHDGQEDKTFDLKVEGDPPAGFEKLRKALFAKQEAATGEDADVDYVYDLPADLAKELTGFRHDHDTPGLPDDAFEVLEQPSRLGKIFGGLFGSKTQ